LHKDDVEELQDDKNEEDDDAWAQTLAKMLNDQKRAEKEEKTGRGARRKAALAKTSYFEGGDASPEKKSHDNGRKSMSVDSEDEYQDKAKDIPVESDNDSTTTGSESGFQNDLNTLRGDLLDVGTTISEMPLKKKKKKKKHPFGHQRPLSPIHDAGFRECGLCNSAHEPGACTMTRTSENLVEYRLMLITHTDDEPWDDRAAAVEEIDKELFERNELHLIDGQPSKPIRKQGEPSSKISAFKPKANASLRVQGDGSVKDGTFIPFVFSNTMKRPSPSASVEPLARKKLKLSPCPLCKADHHGTLEECPFVRAGMHSVRTAIKKLTNEEGDHSDIVMALRKILKRMQTAESSKQTTLKWPHSQASSSTANPS